MGLTLHYQFKLNSATIDQAREQVMALREMALKLPFQEVSELVELNEEECKSDRDRVNDPHFFLKIRACKMFKLEEDTYSTLEPTYIIAFNTIVGEGCEAPAFGLAIHSEPSEINDWSWMSFCKTQYASNPDYGGIENFLKCHLMLIKLLEQAQNLNIVSEVSDEGNYWETRKIEELLSNLNVSNVLIASFAGKFRDSLQKEGNFKTSSPIFEYPNFEYLEAEGERE